jgi:hypothetical protein
VTLIPVSKWQISEREIIASEFFCGKPGQEQTVHQPLFLHVKSFSTIHSKSADFTTTMITISGSQGEGSGQVVRSSVALSLVTGNLLRSRKFLQNDRCPASCDNT